VHSTTFENYNEEINLTFLQSVGEIFSIKVV